MRELKYRFWNEKAKSYNAGRYMIGDDGNIYDVSSGDAYEWHITNDVIPEEYTGLKDKNGKEIYERDIMSDGSIVRFALDDEVGSCGCCVDKFWGSGFIISNNEPIEFLEVIGNIHENPELLEKK